MRFDFVFSPEVNGVILLQAPASVLVVASVDLEDGADGWDIKAIYINGIAVPQPSALCEAVEDFLLARHKAALNSAWREHALGHHGNRNGELSTGHADFRP